MAQEPDVRRGEGDAGEQGRPARVVIVDDHALFTDSLAAALDAPVARRRFEVVATASTAEHGIRAAAREQPDLVLLDFVLPDVEAPDAIPALRDAAPGAKVVVLTAAAEEHALLAALEAGCDGYVTKDRPLDELLEALDTVAAGELSVSPTLLRRVLPRLAPGRQSDPTALTRREREVLEVAARGASNQAIAGELHISLNTVRNHVQNALTKLGAHSKLEAVAIATRRGLIRGPRPR